MELIGWSWKGWSRGKLFVGLVIASISASHAVGPAFADVAEANQWLENQITSDGKVVSPASIATDIQSSSETLSVLQLLGISPEERTNAIKQFILQEEQNNTESIVIKVRHRVANLHSTVEQIDELTLRAGTLQDVSSTLSGVGEFLWYENSVLDTALTLQAFAAAKTNTALVGDLISYLVQQQNTDGSFGFAETVEAKIYNTHHVLMAFKEYQLTYNLNNAITKALAFLEAQRSLDRAWGGAHLTSMSLLAMLPYRLQLDDLESSIALLRSEQLQNGSWNDDAFITALAVRALHAVDNFDTPVTEDSGAIAGSIIDSRSGLVLASVTISGVNVDANALSDAQGAFQINDISSGIFELSFSLAGYETVVAEVSVTIGQISNIGEIALTPTAGLATLTGQVSDHATSLPIAGATVSISGATDASIDTDLEGRYQLAIVPGPITINLSANDYESLSINVSTSANETLNFSPQLYDAGTDPGTVKSDVFGTVVDALGNAIAGVEVQLSNGLPAKQTNAQGRFLFSQLESGDFTFAISKNGYAEAQFEIVVPEAINVNVGALTLYSLSAVDHAVIRGSVAASDTLNALRGVMLSLDNGDQVSTSESGIFLFDKVSAGNRRLTLSLEGYYEATYSFATSAGAVADLGQILLTPNVPAGSSSIYGTLTDVDSGEIIEGARVRINSENLSDTSDALGEYRIEDIGTTTFDVSIVAEGYYARTTRVNLPTHGESTIDFKLQKTLANSQVVINSVQANLASYPAYADVELIAFTENLLSEDLNVVLYLKVVDSLGAVVEQRPAVTIPAGGSVSDAFQLIPAGEEIAIPVSWFPQGTAAGDYQVIVQAYDGSNNQILTENSTIVTMQSTRAIGGAAMFDPPLAQLAAKQPVNISADIVNRGNIDLAAGTLTATVSLKTKGLNRSQQTLSVVDKISDFNTPTMMETDASGDVYVLNVSTRTISRINTDLSTEVVLSGLNYPQDFDIDAAGNFYILNYDRTIQIIAVDGTRSEISLVFYSPRAIEVLNDGTIYAATDDDLYEIAPNGDAELLLTKGLTTYATDIVRDSRGDLLISNSYPGEIFKLSNGTLSKHAEIPRAHGLAIDSQDNLYVTSHLYDGQGALYRVTPNGETNVVASNLDAPYDVIVEPGEAEFLVSNSASDEILRIDLNGNVSTVIKGTIFRPEALAYNAGGNLHGFSSSIGDIRELADDWSATVAATSASGTKAIAFDDTDQLHYATSRKIYRANAGTSGTVIHELPDGSIVDIEFLGDQLLVADSRGRVLASDGNTDLATLSEPVLNSTVLVDAQADGTIFSARNPNGDIAPAALVEHGADGAFSIIPLQGDADIDIKGYSISSSGDHYLSDYRNQKIITVDAAGVQEELATLEFRPSALVVDEINNRIIINQFNSKILHSLDLASGVVEQLIELPQNVLYRSKIQIDSVGHVWSLDSWGYPMRLAPAGTVERFTSMGRYTDVYFDGTRLLGINSSNSSIDSIELDGSASATILNNTSLRTYNSNFAINSNGDAVVVGGSSSTNRMFILDSATGAILKTWHTLNGMTGLAALSVDSLIVSLAKGLAVVQAGKMPELVVDSSSVQELEKDITPNKFIYTQGRSIYRFDISTNEVDLVTTLEHSFYGIAIDLDGSIAVSDRNNNTIVKLAADGSFVEKHRGLRTPKALARDAQGELLVYDAQNDVSLVSDGILSDFRETRDSSISFMDTAANGNILFKYSNHYEEIDATGMTINTENFPYPYNYSESNALVTEDSIYFYSTSARSLVKVDQATKSVKQLSSGVESIVDIESDGERLYILDKNKGMLQEYLSDRSVAKRFSGLDLPIAMHRTGANEFYFQHGDSLITKFDGTEDVSAVTYDLNKLVRTGIFGFAKSGSRFLLSNRDEDLVYVTELSGFTEDRYKVGDTVHTVSVPVEGLGVGGDGFSIDFGEWLPPLQGDFQVSVEHSSANNRLSNVLHVGGAATGNLALVEQTVFPGDRQISGTLTVNGADFTSISQIDPKAVTLATSSGTNGRAIAGDSMGNIYSASYNKIVKIDVSGTISDFVTDVTVGNGLTVDYNDNLYAVSGNDVLKFTPAGQMTTVTTLASTAQAVAVDYQNRLYAIDRNALYQIERDGSHEMLIAAQNGRALTIDRFGNFYILLVGNRIIRVQPDLSVSNYFTEATFEYEGVNVVADCADNLLFAPTLIDVHKETSGEEDVIVQLTGSTGEVGLVFYGPPVDAALSDIDVLFYDRFGQRLLMWTDLGSGKIFSFPVICGGIDVEVALTTRDDVELMSTDPTSTRVTDLGEGRTEHRWKLDQVPSQGQNIELQYLFTDLIVGESRPALESAYLEFTNTFVPDQVIRVPLNIPAVSVEQPIALELRLDATEYNSFDEIDITHSVENLTDVEFSGIVQYRILDAAGDLVESFDDLVVMGLTSYELRDLPSDWNTERTLVGNYRFESVLLDAQGNITSSAEATFSIISGEIGSTNKFSLRTRTDKPTYHFLDAVEIDNLLRNLSNNIIEKNTQLQITVQSPNEDQVHAANLISGDLTPSFSKSYLDLFELDNAEIGEYLVTAIVLDENGQILASDSTTFAVINDLSRSVSGSVVAKFDTIMQGDSQVCTDTITNNGTLDIADFSIIHRLVRMDIAQEIDSDSVSVALNSGASETMIRNIDSSALQPGIYACVLYALIDGEEKALAHDNFLLFGPPIAVEGDLSTSAEPRILVLLDDPGSCAGDIAACGGDVADPYGPANAPGLRAQRAALEALLSSQSWSYRIVTSPADFGDALITGEFNVYALFAEIEEPTFTRTQKLIREHVFGGAGLIVAGDTQRELEALQSPSGLLVSTQNGTPTRLQIEDTIDYSFATSELPLSDIANQITLDSATSVGTYSASLFPMTAITENQFGNGESVYVGFDLLAQLSAPGADAALSNLLIEIIKDVSPTVSDPQLTGAPIPVQLSVTNKGIATPGRAIITLPIGVEVLDTGVAEFQGSTTLHWLFDLEVAETQKLVLWVRVAEGANLDFEALIQTGIAPDFDDHGSLDLAVAVTPIADMATILNRINALTAVDRRYAKARMVLGRAAPDMSRRVWSRAFLNLLYAADEFERYSSVEGNAIRVMLSHQIRRVGIELSR